MAKNVHVTHRQDGSWALISEGSSRAINLYETQADAIDAGRKIAKNNDSDLLIHDLHGKIRKNISYGDES